MVVLKGIPSIISPDLLHVLAKMGHGDEIGHGIPALLKAILTLFPLDMYADSPAILMELVPDDKARELKTPVWTEYQKLIDEAEHKEIKMAEMERFAYYERAKKAYAVVATGETALYGNLILKKGVIAGQQ